MTAPNFNPIFTLTPHVGRCAIPQATAVPASDGASSGSAALIMYCAFKPGSQGSYVSRLRFLPTATTVGLYSTATVLRVFLSSVTTTEGAAAGATTLANTHLIA